MSTKREQFLKGLALELGASLEATATIWADICSRMQEEGQSALFAQQIEGFGECAGWKVARTIGESIDRCDDPAAEVICRFSQLPSYRD